VADKQLTTVTEQLKVARGRNAGAEVGRDRARQVDFPERQSAVADLAARSRKLPRYRRSRSRVHAAEAARRASLAQEFFDEETALLDTLDKLRRV